ncbi:hypothetical protein ACFL2Q_02355 [Thermodesulfobacteriota bacterium]
MAKSISREEKIKSFAFAFSLMDGGMTSRQAEAALRERADLLTPVHSTLYNNHKKYKAGQHEFQAEIVAEMEAQAGEPEEPTPTAQTVIQVPTGAGHEAIEAESLTPEHAEPRDVRREPTPVSHQEQVTRTDPSEAVEPRAVRQPASHVRHLDEETIEEIMQMLEWWKNRPEEPERRQLPDYRPTFKRGSLGSDQSPKTVRLSNELVSRALLKAKTERTRYGTSFSSLIETLLWEFIGCPTDLIEADEPEG